MLQAMHWRCKEVEEEDDKVEKVCGALIRHNYMGNKEMRLLIQFQILTKSNDSNNNNSNTR